MKKKVFSLMMMLLLAVTGYVRAQELTVHDGTITNSYVPFYGLWVDDYTRSEMIYPAEELASMSGGDISSLTFYKSSSNTNTWGSASFQVYLKEVSNTTLDAYIGMTDATIVYEGGINAEGGEISVTINFTTPYHYNGGNLLVGIYETVTGSYSSAYWYGENVTGASASGYNSSSPASATFNQRGFLPKTTFAYSGGSGGGPSGDQLFAVQNGEDVETVVVGARPNGYWMEPFRFNLRNDGGAVTVTRLDFTPNNYFTVVEPELPFAMAHNAEIEVALATGTTDINAWQMVAIYSAGRTARVWDIVAEPYDPAIPDVWELAYDFGTIADGFSYVGVPSQITPTELHNDYTLPFPEIEEGEDAVYKFTVSQDMIINAYVDPNAENGKVALYTEDFNGEGGPMATNNYTGLGPAGNGGSSSGGGAFEAQIGEGTSTTTYFPFHSLWNYSMGENLFLASELTEAGVTSAPFTSLSWYVASTSTTTPQNNISIWMANVSDTELTSTSHTTGGMTLVYTGSNVLPVAGEWNEFVFNAGNFSWDGHSNILILCTRNNGTYQGSISWQSHNPGFTGMCYHYSDTNGGYDVSTTPYTGMYTSSTNRPNIIMKGGNRESNRDMVFNFEDQQIPAGWNNDATYPWTVVSENGSYVMKSGNGGVASSSSTISATFDLTSDGTISFDALCMGEGTSTAWDKCIFTLDGTQQFAYGAHVSGWNNYTYDVTAGTHTCTWSYTKDSSVNPTGDYFMVDNVTIIGAGGGGSVEPNDPMAGYYATAGPVIENLPVRAGTYYLVASATQADYTVYINADNMPCPAIEAEGFAFNPTPADNEDEVEPGSVTLRWMVPEYATGWRLVFGSTYHPEVGHPQTIIYPEDGSFSTNMANSFTVRNLYNNTNYFWRVEFNNDGCPDGVSSPVWGFTTHLNIPTNLTAVDYTVFDDEQIVLNWNAVVDRTYRMYNVYRDGVCIGHTTMNNIGNTTYTDGPLAYNMGGYTYYVTAVYDEGESAPSDPVTVKVSGYGDVNGYVYEQDGTTGIAGATVTMVGQDEFGDDHTYNFTTNNQGYYSGHIYVGSYNGSAACNGYQTINAPVQGNPIAIDYNNTTTPIDYILDENFDPVCTVIAQYYPDSLDPQAPYVKVYWGCGLPGSEIVEPFETGDFSLFDWQIDPTYPWSITTTSPYEGDYCMKSGGAGVANVVSNMTVTVDIPADGLMSFFGKISCESNWDYGYFYIDGVEKGSYTGAGTWAERTFDITAGEHTFQWRYTKDGSVNSNDDCFYVDYITFYKQPAPAVPGMTYDFEDHSMQGWTSLDADGDGYGWMVGSELMSGVAGHNGSADFVFSQSYNNSVGVLYPDNYLVSPQVQLGGIVRFYACAQDASYAAEHFGVAVSTTNTNPSSFTTIQEWTMSAKNVADPVGKPVKESRSGRAQGNWYEYTVDLSAYSGMGYVAIRHFNCSDMFYLDVDDITIGEPGKSAPETRTFSHYRVYRTNCYNDGPYTEENTVVLACELLDTLYIDVSWPDVAPGVYKWGVSCVYNGNHRGEEYESEITWSEPVNVEPEMATRQVVTIGDGTSTNYYAPYNSLWGYSFVEQVYTAAEIGTPGVINAISFNLRESDAAQTNQIDVFMKNVSRTNFADNSDWEPVTASDMVFSGTVTFSPGWSTITLDTPFQYDGTSNLMIGVHEYTSGYSTRYFYHSSVPNGLISGHSDSVNPDPYNMGSYTGTMYTQNYRANIQIDITPGGGTPGPGVGNNPIQEPRESEIVWSNCLDKDMYMSGVDVTVLLNSADSPEGTTVDFTNLNEYEQLTYPIAQLTLDESGYYAFDSFRRGDYAIKVEHVGYETIYDTVSIWEPTSLRYVMIEILYGVENVYVSRTGWAMWDDSHNNPGGGIPGGGGGGQGGNGDTFNVDFEGGLPAGWTVNDANNDGWTWCLTSAIPTTWTYYASLTLDWYHGGSNAICSGSYINGVGAVTPDEYLISPAVNLSNGSQLSFWVAATDASYPADHFGVFVSTTGTNPNDFTSVQEWTLTGKKEGVAGGFASRDGNGFRLGTWYNYTVDLSSYAGSNRYIAFRHFNCYDQYIMCLDDIALTNGAKSNDRHFESYKVLCTSIDGVPIFNHNTVHPFCQLSTDEPYHAPLVEGDHYLLRIASVYSTGQSAWSEPVEWQYEPCDHWGPVDEVTVDVNGQGNHIQWVFEHGYNPYGGGTPGPGPGAGDAFSVDFEGGLPAGWTVVDANNDGWTWCLTSAIPTTWTYYASLTLDWYHGGTNAICSGSYINGLGAVTPDEYLISPAVNLANGSQLSFWVAATDASYPADHFGVFVSTTGTNPNDFTSVQEWTLTAKKEGMAGGFASRDGNGFRLGTWYNYTVDLSAYAGNARYIAFRHFNCYDQYIMCLDDIELTSGAKGGQSVDMGSEIYRQYSEDGVLLNFHAIKDIYFRSYLLYTLSKSENFKMIDEEQYGLFIVTPAYEMDNFMEEFESFYVNAETDFSMLSKIDVTNQMSVWKSSVEAADYLSITMDVNTAALRADNDHCLSSMPFCTSEVMEFEAAYQGGATGESGPDYGCLSSQPYPSWYHMRIHTAGQFVIHMEAHDASGAGHDIDYCIWGPFTDPYEPCVDDLTCDKMVDCSYSTASVEDVYLGYPISEHNHGNSSLADGNCVVANNNPPHVPQVGEYYILVITNYSQQQQTISFTKTEGEGETDCEIVVPTDLIGFLITQDGEYLAFAGPDDREYTDIDEFGEHEYCVRPIYPGTMILPDQNFGWSMGCPVCQEGGDICAAGAPIHGEALNTTDQVKVWWGDENPGPGPGGCEGDEFTVDFESGMPAGWTTIDADGDGYNWNLSSSTMGAGYGHNGSSDMIFSQSYDNNYGALTPDNYLVSPAVTLCEGSTFSFWACAQDASWSAEHFGVAISDDGVNFGMVQEWTMTAKGERYDGPRGMRDQGSWYQYSVDLSDYAGEGRYIAIRHFNCTDMFYIDVDDIELTNGAKATRAGIEKYRVYRSTENANYSMIAEVTAVAGQTYYEYIDTPAGAGTYYYQVTAVYADCESDPAVAYDNPNVNYVVVSVDAVNENADEVAIYPNPTKGNITIQAKGMNHITVVSVLGQVVYDAEVDADNITLNMNQFNVGMYTVRISTTEGVAVRRVTVIR